MEFYLFHPQLGMPLDAIVERSLAAEQAGFVGITGLDHLAAPGLDTSNPTGGDNQPLYEAMLTNTWIASRTDRLRVGSLVLCDSLRHPALLAAQAVTLDHASGGRFDLGIGWGSIPTELDTFGVGSSDPRHRVGRLKETLEIIAALWAGETLDYEGEYFTLKGAAQSPPPLGRIPIVIGGVGRKTMRLVAKHADWWNLWVGFLDRLESLREFAGDARVSLYVQATFVHSPETREETVATARRLYGDVPVTGTGPELVDYFSSLAERGVERSYVWFTDFSAPETIAAFGEEVIAQVP